MKNFFVLFKSRLFLKLFFSFILVSVFASVIAYSVSAWMFHGYSYDFVEDKIDTLLEKEQQLYMYLFFDELDKAERFLQSGAADYFYVYENGGSELLERTKRNYSSSEFPRHLSRLVMEYELNRPMIISSALGNEYRIEINPTIFKPLVIQSKLSRLLLFIGVAAVVCALLARLISRRILAIKNVTDKAIAGNITMNTENKRYSKDEIGELAQGLDKMMAALQKNIDAKNKVLANISHELRSPLARLMIATELLKLDNDKSSIYFQRIEKEINQMDRLISNIIQAQQHNFNDQTFQFKAVQLNELLMQLIADVEFEFINQQVEINTDFSVVGTVMGDAEKLTSVFLNLLRNAVIHNQGEVKITVKLTQQNKLLLIEIIDDGSGVGEEELASIFEPFMQNTSSESGFGLGLAIANSIINQHHANIKAENIYSDDKAIIGFKIIVEMASV